MCINLLLIRLYFNKNLTYGIELLPFFNQRGICLFGITWDDYGDCIQLYIDLFYKNILNKEIYTKIK